MERARASLSDTAFAWSVLTSPVAGILAAIGTALLLTNVIAPALPSRLTENFYHASGMLEALGLLLVAPVFSGGFALSAAFTLTVYGARQLGGLRRYRARRFSGRQTGLEIGTITGVTTGLLVTMGLFVLFSWH